MDQELLASLNLSAEQKELLKAQGVELPEEGTEDVTQDLAQALLKAKNMTAPESNPKGNQNAKTSGDDDGERSEFDGDFENKMRKYMKENPKKAMEMMGGAKGMYKNMSDDDKESMAKLSNMNKALVKSLESHEDLGDLDVNSVMFDGTDILKASVAISGEMLKAFSKIAESVASLEERIEAQSEVSNLTGQAVIKASRDIEALGSAPNPVRSVSADVAGTQAENGKSEGSSLLKAAQSPNFLPQAKSKLLKAMTDGKIASEHLDAVTTVITKIESAKGDISRIADDPKVAHVLRLVEAM